jgi:hypothetical protein
MSDLKATGLEKEPEASLCPASIGKTGKLSRGPLVRTDAVDMLKRSVEVGVSERDQEAAAYG